jgi:Flp pilus assembly protein TadG
MRLRQTFRDTGGAAAAEMALILPAIAFVLLNVVDLGSYIWHKMQVDLAAHEAVGAARVLCDESDATHALPATVAGNCTGYDTAMTAAAQTTSLGTGVTIGSTTEAYYCANTDGELVHVAAVDGTVPDDCDATVTGSTSKPGLYISTVASYSFSPVFPGASVASVLTTPITRTAWLRLQ